MTVDIICGDAREALARFPDGHFHCCITSPPYWGLRCYNTEPLVWGDGWRGSLGLEPTPDLYVEHIVEVMREVRRTLREDGTCWLNMGDGYAADWNSRRDKGGGGFKDVPRDRNKHPPPGLKPKDLLMMPARVALALQQPHHYGPIRAETDRAWMAALIDGEGTISIARNVSAKSRGGECHCQVGYTPFISIGNQDRELLDRCVQITGFGKVHLKDRPNVDDRGIRSRRHYYGWRIDAEKATKVLRDIYPYLVAKRRQAVLAYTLDVSNKAGRSLRGNGPLPTSEQDKRAFLKDLCNRANQREDIDLPAWAMEPPSNIEQGWWLRSENIWNKKNPMPESCNDRTTRSHEYVYLLAKSARYAYDADAVREPSVSPEQEVHNQRYAKPYATYDERAGDTGQPGNVNNVGIHSRPGPGGRNLRSVWTIPTQPFGLEMCGSCKVVYTAAQYHRLRGGSMPQCQTEIAEGEKCGGVRWLVQDGGAMCAACETFYTAKELERLPRAAKCRRCGAEDAWLSHFATFPEKLVEPCILAGTSEWGCCPECGAPWMREINPTPEYKKLLETTSEQWYTRRGHDGYDNTYQGVTAAYVTVGWRPGCTHGHEPTPCRCLDPFAGSGTVGVVAERLGRHSTLIELNPDYCELARHRTAQRGLFAMGVTA